MKEIAVSLSIILGLSLGPIALTGCGGPAPVSEEEAADAEIDTEVDTEEEMAAEEAALTE